MKQQNKIPEGWEYKKISQVSESHAGGTPSRAEKSYYSGSILWVKSGEVDNRNIIDTEEKITEEALKSSSAKIVPKNTVLVAMYGATVGKVGILKREATTNQAVLAIISKDNSFDCEFMYYLLSSKAHKLINTTQGTGQPNLSKDLIDNLEVIIPPLGEQKAISKILSEVDLELNNVERERRATERLKRGIMVKLLENKNWKFESLSNKEYFELIMGQSPPSSSYNNKQEGMPFLQGNADFGVICPSYSKYTKNPLKIAEPNDILISVRAPVGEINLSKDKICMGRGLGAIRILKGNYLFYYYYFNHIKKEIEHMGQGSTFKAITLNELKKYPYRSPN